MGEVPRSEAGAAGVWPAAPCVRSPGVRLSWLVSPEHKEGLRTPTWAHALSLLGPVGVPGNPVAPSMPMALGDPEPGQRHMRSIDSHVLPDTHADRVACRKAGPVCSEPRRRSWSEAGLRPCRWRGVARLPPLGGSLWKALPTQDPTTPAPPEFI